MMVRTRIAPSPTGFPHIGTIYQVLFDFAFAKKHKGSFVCRIEDTDRARFVEGAENVIYSSFDWFGLHPDESPKVGGPYGPYRQSERLAIYQKYALELIEKGHAYYCFCTKDRLEQMRKNQQEKGLPPMYDKHCLNLSAVDVKQQLDKNTPHVIRLNVPHGRTISFTDMIAGNIEFMSDVVDDQVLIKSDGFPTYHLGVVVDDHLMKITHIFRGKEWISSTPKHILLYEFFGWEIPSHGHLPLILNADGKGKLSKRHGHASVDYYKTEGFLPEAVLNFLSNIVWHHPQEKEIYSIDEFIALFEIEQITSQGARFDVSKLEWMNGEYIRQLSTDALVGKLLAYLKENNSLPNSKNTEEILRRTVVLIQSRIKKLSEYMQLCSFFFDRPTQYESATNTEWLQKVFEKIVNLPEWNHDVLLSACTAVAEELSVSRSKLFMEIRIAITGKKIGPPLFESMELLGKSESLQRIQMVNK